MANKLTKMAKELLIIESDLPNRFDYSLKPYATIDDFEIYIFEQVWGSTALGLGGVGGQAMTAANTYVFIPISTNEKCFVYFGSRFAYAVPYSRVFWEDVAKQNMEPVYHSGKYYTKDGTDDK